MGNKLCRFPSFLENIDTVERSNDFGHYVTLHGFTTVASDSGTAAVGDGLNGVLTLLPSDGTVADNDETYVKGANEIWKMSTGQIVFRARIKFAEGNTNTANIAVGLIDAVAADTIIDGGGIKASCSAMLLYKKDGETAWRCFTSVATTRTDTLTSTTAGSTAYQVIEIEYLPVTSTAAKVTFKIDGVQLTDVNGTKVVHDVTFASATEMQECFGIKNGAITAVETLLVDYVSTVANRA